MWTTDEIEIVLSKNVPGKRAMRIVHLPSGTWVADDGSSIEPIVKRRDLLLANLRANLESAIEVEELHIGRMALRLSSTKEGWCLVDLVGASNVEKLGAEMRSRILAGLSGAIEDEIPFAADRSVDGVPVGHAFTFRWHRCSVLSGNDGGDRLLAIQASDGRGLACERLSAAARRKLLNDVNAMMRRVLGPP